MFHLVSFFHNTKIAVNQSLGNPDLIVCVIRQVQTYLVNALVAFLWHNRVIELLYYQALATDNQLTVERMQNSMEEAVSISWYIYVF